MPQSPFFIRIKADILKLVDAIPEGRLCSYRSIGEHLDVMPRQVAYILATLDPMDKLEYPWHRVVGHDGTLGKVKRRESGESQAELLEAEGIPIADHAIAIDQRSRLLPAADLKSGVPKQTQPKDAPTPRQRKARRGT